MLKSPYLPFFQRFIFYGIFFWGGNNDIHDILLLQKSC